jgi:hypothetical protein
MLFFKGKLASEYARNDENKVSLSTRYIIETKPSKLSL